MSEGVAAMDLGDLSIDTEDIPKGGNPYLSTPGSRALSAALKASYRGKVRRDLERYGGNARRETETPREPGTGVIDFDQFQKGRD